MSSKRSLSVEQAVIRHDVALEVIGAAVSKAEELGIRVCVAVVDSGGGLAGFVRMPGAFLISSELAIAKAKSAASIGLPADVVEQVLAQEAPRVRDGLLQSGLVFIRGGLPLHEEARLIGAIGVSGGSEAQDVACAEAGNSALGR